MVSLFRIVFCFLEKIKKNKNKKEEKTLTNNSKHKILTKHQKLLSPLCHITTKKQKMSSKKFYQTNPMYVYI
jgi:hypothetical protein